MWIKTFESFEEIAIPIILANPLKTRAIAETRIKTCMPSLHSYTMWAQDQGNCRDKNKDW